VSKFGFCYQVYTSILDFENRVLGLVKRSQRSILSRVGVLDQLTGFIAVPLQ
jgi:hypothetical protein